MHTLYNIVTSSVLNCFDLILLIAFLVIFFNRKFRIISQLKAVYEKVYKFSKLGFLFCKVLRILSIMNKSIRLK